MSGVSPEAEVFACPTCNAKQTASRQCRRCKCDLSLVLAVRDQARQLHEQCLRQLQRGAYRPALISAERRYRLSPDRVARRLLAVARLCAGDFQAALDLSDQGASA